MGFSNISLYKELLYSLIYEKPNMTSEKKAKKEELLSKLVREKLIINGDEKFKNEVNNCINDIIALKPGRKLIKTIVQLMPEQKIQIIPSKISAFCEKKFNITFSLNPEKYHILGKRISSRPAFVTLAHELIHTYHFLKNPDDYFIRSCIDDETIVMMDNLEEQRTIVGFDNRLFSKEGIASKLDVLCENAFLLALGLPPRIDHHAPIGEDLDSNTQYNLDSYFEWLENAVSNISHIPIERADDKDFFISYISLNPSAAPKLPEKLKNDEEFMLELISKDKRLLKQFPELSKNKDFMLKLISCNEFAIFQLDPALLNEKEYLIKCLNLVACDENKMLIESVYKKIEEPLKADPDIRKYFDV